MTWVRWIATSAGPTAMPAETPMPVRRSTFLPKSDLDQLRQRVDGRLLVGAVGGDRDRRAARRRQQQNSHDALAVHHLRVAADADLRLEARRQVDEPRRGPRVQPELVDDGDGAARSIRAPI